MTKAGRASRRTSTGDKTASEVWLAYLTASVGEATQKFRRRLKRCRTRNDSNSIHELRVEARRLLVWCDLLRWLRPGGTANTTRRELKRLLRLLARLRDTQVQLELLEAAPVSLRTAARRLRRSLRREEKRQSDRVRHRCRDIHPLRMSAGLVGAAGSLAAVRRFREGRTLLPSALQDWMDHLQQRARKSYAQVAATRPASLHELRIALKHLRYGLEAMAPPAVPGFTSLVRDLRRAQGILGEIQDADVFLRLLEDGKPDEAHAYAGLAAWLTRRRATRIRQFFARKPRWDPMLRTAPLLPPCPPELSASRPRKSRVRRRNN